MKEIFFAISGSIGACLFLLLILIGIAQFFMGDVRKNNFGN